MNMKIWKPETGPDLSLECDSLYKSWRVSMIHESSASIVNINYATIGLYNPIKDFYFL